jgi:RHS repeat-associated protein
MVSAGDGTNSVAYLYDALDRKVKRTQGSDVQKYTHDGQDIVLDDINSTLTKYQNGLGIDDKLKLVSGGTSKYFLQNHLRSTVDIANSSGVSIDSNSFDSFGTATNGSFTNRFQYTGREADPLTGQQFNRARFYDPTLGRFNSEDPIGLAGGINQYSYVSNGPVNKTDPSGLYEIDVHYYLTYYLAMKTGCFSASQAREIAEGNQGTDEDPATAPGFGMAFQNGVFHALNPDARRGTFGPDWSGIGPQTTLRRLGRALHYYQDTFSHEGYGNPYYGHLFGTHEADKTNSDPMKAMEMAGGTYGVLASYGKSMGCKCGGQITPDIASTTFNFSNMPGAYFPKLYTTHGSYLGDKVNALGIPYRQQGGAYAY